MDLTSTTLQRICKLHQIGRDQSSFEASRTKSLVKLCCIGLQESCEVPWAEF